MSETSYYLFSKFKLGFYSSEHEISTSCKTRENDAYATNKTNIVNCKQIRVCMRIEHQFLEDWMEKPR